MPTAADKAKAVTVNEMASSAQYNVMRAGREKVQQSATRWRRVTDGHPCGFCAMVASRGPVYRSASSAGDGRRYHTRCGCTVEPFEGSVSDWVPSPDEQRYIKAYDEAYRTGIKTEDLADKIEAILDAGSDLARAGKSFDLKWLEGRDVHIHKPRDVKLRELALKSNRDDIARLKLDTAHFEGQIAERTQLILDEGLTKRQAGSIMKKQPDVQRWRASVAQNDELIATARRQIDDIERELADVNLPDFDPENPLKFYGDRVKFYTPSDEAVTFATDLELFPRGAHELLRGHFAEVDGSGFHLGVDGNLSKLDAFKDAQQARGYAAGKTTDDAAGAYSPLERVVGCTNSHEHGSASMALHEASHALDDAMLHALGRTPSYSDEFREAWHGVIEYIPQRGYYQPAGNPTGYLSEAFAEHYARYVLNRATLSGDALAEEVVLGTKGPKGLAAARNLVSYFEQLEKAMPY